MAGIIRGNERDEHDNSSICKRVISRLSLPPFCERYRGQIQSNPLALLLNSIIPASITSSLLELATTSLNPRYITHAKLTHNNNNNNNNNNNDNDDDDDYDITTVALSKPNNHKLAVFHSPSHVQALEEILLPIVDEYMSQTSLPSRLHADGMMLKPAGLNPRLRILRYDLNDDFQPHYDKTTEFPERNQTSYITVLLYLNTLPEMIQDVAVGGRTLFHSSRVITVGEKIQTSWNTTNEKTNKNNDDDNVKQQFAISCVEGSVCLFEHDLYHSGEVIKGENCTKWILRTDVLFQKKDNPKDASSFSNPIFELNNEKIVHDDDENAIIGNNQIQANSILTLAEFLPSYITVYSVSYDEIIQAFQDIGISPNDTSLESFITPGKQMVNCLLSEVEIMVSSPISFNGIYDAIKKHLQQ